MPLVEPKGIMPPLAERRAHSFTRHGQTVGDDFAWLRADNWQEVMRKPEALPADIRAYLEAENAYTRAVLAPTEGLQESLFAEMKARIKEDDSTVPSPDGAWAYYTSYVTGGEHPRLCRQPREGGPEEVLLDGDREAAGIAYWYLENAEHSPDHRLLAYAVDDTGAERCRIRFRDLATGKDLPDVVESAGASLAWSVDSRVLFYTHRDESHRSLKAYRHVLGTPASADVLVYEEADQGFFVGVGSTQSRRFVTILTRDHTTSEVRLVEADAPLSEPRLIEPRRAGREYAVEHHGERLYILTNDGEAEDFKIVTAPVNAPGAAAWREVEPHRPGRLILAMTLYRGHMVRLEREDGLPRIVVRHLADGHEHAIAFDEEAYSLGYLDGEEFDTTRLRFTYSSMTTPGETFDYDMESRERVLRKVQEVPSGHDPARYVTRRVMAPSHDGALVPVSLLYRQDLALDGSAPCLLYGYGSYGIAMPAAFSTARLSLVDRGFVYAIAHIRGGKDKGYHWYTDGKLDRKVNTFKDFIAAGEHLARLGITRRGRLVGHGGSAGGMLMGAVANMAPDLFLGIIAEVPFVDVLNTILDETLPLTPPEWKEWGNPIDDPAAFATILGYSPYDNVAARAYPAILAMGGLTDPRVTYWEPAKWVARLRAVKTDGNPLLLRINMDAGHGGAAGRFERLRETALAYAFALAIAGKA